MSSTPDGVYVMLDLEVAMRAAWTEPHSNHHVRLPFPSDSGFETLVRKNHVERSKTGRVRNIGAASLLRGDAKDTSSVAMVNSILPGDLESVSADEPPAPTPASGRVAKGGRR